MAETDFFTHTSRQTGEGPNTRKCRRVTCPESYITKYTTYTKTKTSKGQPPTEVRKGAFRFAPEQNFIEVSVYENHSQGPSIEPGCTRCCFTMTHMIQVCGNFIESEYLSHILVQMRSAIERIRHSYRTPGQNLALSRSISGESHSRAPFSPSSGRVRLLSGDTTP